MKLNLHYDKPAKRWVEALPLGNGRVGAMVTGGVESELIYFNEDTLWSGYPADHNKKGMSGYVKEAARLTKERKYHEAEKVIQDNIPGDYSQAYMPMGTLKIETQIKVFDEYKRELCLNTAVHSTAYKSGDVSYKKETFISHPHQVFVHKLTADTSKKITCELSYDCQLKNSVTVEKGNMTIEGVCPAHAEPSYLNSEESILYYDDADKKGIRFCAFIHVENIGGTISHVDGKLKVVDADEIIIYLAVRSNFVSYDVYPETGGKNYRDEAMRDLERAKSAGYEKLLADHVADFSGYYERMSLKIGEDDKAHLPTDERLQAFKDGESDVFLPSYLFGFGRYLMISSSRNGTQATNLQGIWNHSLVPPWSSNYTININTEMNYWCVFMANLAEFAEPLVGLIKDLSVAGEVTAREYYDARGFVAHHNTDIWRLANPVGGARNNSVRYSFWGLSTGWLCEHLFEQYEYTLDEDFLRKTAYPIMKKSAQFYIDTLGDDGEGNLAMMPSTSPENGFVFDEKVCTLSKTTTMTTAIIKELFTNCVKACEVLKCDEAFKEELESLIEKLPPFKVGSDGRLLEWNEEFEEEDPLHRHISHLYPLHPARLITVDETPELAEACRKVLETKGLTGTGWSLGWKVNMWARLLDGEMALKLIKQQLTLVEGVDDKVVMEAGGSYPNLFDAHPPFQIDGNFGAVSGIAEMLLQSYDDKIIILPALPSEWESGEVKGLCAKNNVTVDIKWAKNKLTEAKLTFNSSVRVKIYCGGKCITVNSDDLGDRTLVISAEL